MGLSQGGMVFPDLSIFHYNHLTGLEDHVELTTLMYVMDYNIIVLN